MNSSFRLGYQTIPLYLHIQASYIVWSDNYVKPYSIKDKAHRSIGKFSAFENASYTRNCIFFNMCYFLDGFQVGKINTVIENIVK